MPENGKHPDEKPSRLSRVVFFLLCAQPIFAALAFGAVDVWALGAASLLAGLTAICWLADAFLKREFSFSRSALQIPIAALIVVGAIQLLPLRRSDFTSDLLSIPATASLTLAPYMTRLAIIQLIVYFVFFAAALAFVNNHSRLQKIVSATIVFSSLMAFFGLLQRLANLEAIYGLRPPGQAYPFASFVNQHHFAAYMEMTMGLTLGLLFGKATKKNKRAFLLIAVCIMGIALVFTSSRGGMISLLAVVAFVVAANLRQKPMSGETDLPEADNKSPRRKIALVGGGLALILVLFGAVLLLGGDESLMRGIGLHNPEDIANGRTHFWSAAWRIFLDYPILGAGLDAFGVAYTRYDSWNGVLRVEQAHNDYLQILADAGVAGFACVAAFIYLLFKKGARAIRGSADSFRRGAATGALAGCFGVLIHSFFDFPLRTPSNALYFLTLATVAIVEIAPPKRSRKKRAG